MRVDNGIAAGQGSTARLPVIHRFPDVANTPTCGPAERGIMPVGDPAAGVVDRHRLGRWIRRGGVVPALTASDCTHLAS
jgi:hypothetical protein